MGQQEFKKRVEAVAQPPLELNLTTTASSPGNEFYAPTVCIYVPALKRMATFLLDTGSMSSIISQALLTKDIRLLKTGISVTAANSERLDVRGVACLDIELPGTKKSQEALFVVINQKWKNYDGIIGNDVLLRNKAVIDLHNQTLTYSGGAAPLKMLQQQVNDLVMLQTTIENVPVPPEPDDEVDIFCMPGQSVPARSTKIIRFKTNRKLVAADRCLLVPDRKSVV